MCSPSESSGFSDLLGWVTAHDALRGLIERHEEFLRSTDRPEDEIVEKLLTRVRCL